MNPCEAHQSTRLRSLYKAFAFFSIFIAALAWPPEPLQAGETPLSVSPSVAVALEKFQENSLPGFFAVSEGGNAYGFAHCRTDADCGEQAETLAHRFCREESGEACHTLTDKEETLWPGPVTMPAPEDVALVKAGWRSFPTLLSWPSDAPAVHAWSLVPEGKPVGWMKISRPSPLGPCYGAYAADGKATGNWHLICGPDQTATGTYRRETDQWVSEGRSSAGETILIVTRFK